MKGHFKGESQWWGDYSTGGAAKKIAYKWDGFGKRECPSLVAFVSIYHAAGDILPITLPLSTWRLWR